MAVHNPAAGSFGQYLRRHMSREQAAALQFPVPFWPYGPALAIVFMLFIFGVLGYFPDTQAALLVGVAWVVFLVLSYLLWRKPRGGQGEARRAEPHR